MRRKRFLIGGLIIVGALAYLIYGGMQEAMVYFVTPTELKAQEAKSHGKFLRLGGMVVKGSLHRNSDGLSYRFLLTDGNARVPVYFHGIPPDLFADGKGAVVEGKMGQDGVFIATMIMAKHAEDYSPAEHGKPDSPKRFIPAPEEKTS
ncbi:MAG: cytochrome c maturation protein CcmE [Candidatus Binatia bacterium]